ncbi:MAG: hypothetical protein ACM3SW_09795 [Actinomycetota bacterium]
MSTAVRLKPALGKASASTVAAAVFQQNHFFVHHARLPWSSRLYFHDERGRTLAFVRNAKCEWNKGIRVFTDPTLSFELLAIKPVRDAEPGRHFNVIDSVNSDIVGRVRHLPTPRLQRQEWQLLGPARNEVFVIREDSALLGLMQRYLAVSVPQSYTFTVAQDTFGSAVRVRGLFSPNTEIELGGDGAKPVDRRLVVAALVLILARA